MEIATVADCLRRVPPSSFAREMEPFVRREINGTAAGYGNPSGTDDGCSDFILAGREPHEGTVPPRAPTCRCGVGRGMRSPLS